MIIVRYRLLFRDGTYSPWSTDFERIKKDAEFFRAIIESKPFIVK